MKVVISSGHGLYVRGASGILDEVDEARRVAYETSRYLNDVGVDCVVFHDNTSTDQSQNLSTIVDYHNSKERDLDVSIHFNAFEPTAEPRGTEVLYLTTEDIAQAVVNEIAKVGFINRGAKYRDDLYFLNQTDKPAILIEVCFVDSEADAQIYQGSFDPICLLIANGIISKGVVS